jgi:hypothetical protein
MNAKTRSKILIGIATAVAAYVLFGPTDSPTIEAASTTAPAVSRSETRTSLAPPVHRAMRAMMMLATRVTAASASDALFATHSLYMAPPATAPEPPAATAATEPVAPPVPTAPPLPFAYIGTFTPEGERPVFFLTQGDRVYNVRVGETLDNLYSVDGFSNGQLLLTYKPLKIQQQLAIGGGP